MQFTTLGKMGWKVSRLGLGCGGHSRLGKSTGRSEDESVAIVKRALERDINFIDTAEGYGTEDIVGKGIKGHDRSKIYISTKKGVGGENPIDAAKLRAALEQSLTRLGTDYIDIYNLHGLHINQYQYALDTLVPEMQKFKTEGKIRALGVTEVFNNDRGHQMFQRGLGDGCWEVIMVGFNILNQSARQRVLAKCIEMGIGTQCMFAVRAAFSQPDKMREIIVGLKQSGTLAGRDIDESDPFAFITRDGHAPTLADAAYRFCRDEPGMHVILCGTGNVQHLEENLKSIDRPPLPAKVRERLVRMFEGIDTVSGQ